MSLRLILTIAAAPTPTPSPAPVLTGTSTSTITSTATSTTTSTSSSTPTPPPTVTGTSPAHADLILWLVVGGIIAAGLVVILGRMLIKSGQGGPAASIIRSWIAISLVIGLLIFCAATLLGSDTSLQSILFGGLIASTGAAIAFYFSSQGADRARADILNAVTTIGQGAAEPRKFSQAAPPPGKLNVPYPPYQIIADGSPRPSYYKISGSLPDGLILDKDGTLHGTPTKAGTDFKFTVAAVNSAGLIPSPEITMTIAGS